MTDESIQKLVENGNAAEGSEGDAYRMVFNALKKSPQFTLPSNFAHRVAAMAPAHPKAFNWDKFFLISGCISFLLAMTYAIVSIHATFSVGVFSFISGYPGLIAFAIFFVVLLNWIDKKWISKSTAV
jgi:hypothetical protein